MIDRYIQVSSGIESPIITPDEWQIVRGYRMLRAEGSGMLHVELSEHRVSKLEVKHSMVRWFNGLLDGDRKLRD